MGSKGSTRSKDTSICVVYSDTCGKNKIVKTGVDLLGGGGCTGVRTPVGLGQQPLLALVNKVQRECKKIKSRNMAQFPRFFLF